MGMEKIPTFHDCRGQLVTLLSSSILVFASFKVLITRVIHDYICAF